MEYIPQNELLNFMCFTYKHVHKSVHLNKRFMYLRVGFFFLH